MILTTLVLLIAWQSCLAQQFTVHPVSVVQAAGLEAVFECQYPKTTHHGWGINGESPPDDQFPPDVTRIPPSVDSPTARLIIPATPQYNNTVVLCKPVVREGETLMSVLSENVTLKVQGSLPSVTYLHFLPEQSSNTTITISWEAPFSLNLTTAEPNIQYCVDVYNVTGGGDDHLQSVCDITDTHYTFTASDPDQLFNLTVTPRSNVEGSLNGTTSQPVQGYLIQEPIIVNATEIEVMGSIATGSESVVLQLMIPRNLFGTPGQVPTRYSIEVNCDSQSPECPVSSTMENHVVILSVGCDIERHQICSLTLTAENNAGLAKYSPSLTSTHDVQIKQAVYSALAEQIDVSCSYLANSTDPGYLVIAWSPQNLSPAYRVAHRNGLEPTTNVSLPGQYEDARISVYDLRKSGRPEKSPAVLRHVTSISTTGSGHSPSSNMATLLQRCEITGDNGEICITCSFSADEVTGCVGVIHSAQLEDLTLTVLTVERSGGRECTSVPEGDHYVAVFGLKRDNTLEQEPANVTTVSTEVRFSTPINELTTQGIIATAIFLLLVFVILLGISVMVLCPNETRRDFQL